MLSLRITRSIVEVEVCNLIDQGHELVDKLVQVGSIKSCEDLPRVQRDLVDWSEEVLSHLNNLFEGGDELIGQWNALQVGRVREDKSLREDIKRLAYSAQRGTDWLRNLHNRLKDFPLSPTTAM